MILKLYVVNRLSKVRKFLLNVCYLASNLGELLELIGTLSLEQVVFPLCIVGASGY